MRVCVCVCVCVCVSVSVCLCLCEREREREREKEREDGCVYIHYVQLHPVTAISILKPSSVPTSWTGWPVNPALDGQRILICVRLTPSIIYHLFQLYRSTVDLFLTNINKSRQNRSFWRSDTPTLMPTHTHTHTHTPQRCHPLRVGDQTLDKCSCLALICVCRLIVCLRRNKDSA